MLFKPLKNKSEAEVHFRFKGIHITTMLSIMWVLYLVGMVLVGGALVWNLKQQFKGRVHMNVYFRPTTPADEIFKWEVRLKSTEGVRKVDFYSSDDALRFMEEEVGADIDSLLGHNPFPPMLDVYFYPDYVASDYLDTLARRLSASPYVRDVVYARDFLAKLNHYFRLLLMAGGSLAVLFFLISWVLINNAVRVTLYSDRFVVRTMELVGATRGFIIRPYLIQSMLIGVAAGLLADALLLGTVHLFVRWLPEAGPAFYDHLWVLGGAAVVLPLLGMLIAGVSTFFAVRRFLAMPLEELY